MNVHVFLAKKFSLLNFSSPWIQFCKESIFFLVSLAFGNSIVVHRVDYWYFKKLSHQNKLKHFQGISAYREHVIRSPHEPRCSLCICIVTVFKTFYIYFFLVHEPGILPKQNLYSLMLAS